MHSVRSLNKEKWSVIYDEKDEGLSKGWIENFPEEAITCVIPSVAQMYYPDKHGVFFYRCIFDGMTDIPNNHRLYLKFGGADYAVKVWLNGEFLGSHEGGEFSFDFDVTEKYLKNRENVIIVRLINPEMTPHDGLTILNTPHKNKGMEHIAGNTMNSGGMWYGVNLEILPEIIFEDFYPIADIENSCIHVNLKLINSFGYNGNVNLNISISGGPNGNFKSDFFARKELLIDFADNDREKNVSSDIKVDNPRLWDIDDPCLYHVTAEIVSPEKISRTVRVGFKDFCVKDGYFYLNGRKIFLKSSHTGNAFPIGQLMPYVKGQMQKDMILAKAAGFNCVRSISGVLRQEQLDLCDELGLMVYEECSASWCLGGFGTVKEGIDEMLKRFDDCTVDMIKRDRHHASICIFGLLNETFGGDAVSVHAYNSLKKFRQYDKEHLILFSSGSFEQDPNYGHFSNPGSFEWAKEWGDDGEDKFKKPNCNYWEKDGDGLLIDTGYTVADYHPYPEFPMSYEASCKLRTYGKNSKPVFISENGFGPLLNVIEEYRHFQQIGDFENAEDRKWMEEQSRKMISDWNRLGLGSAYPFPEWFLRESQRQSARDRLDLFDCIRSNPQYCGYSITGLMDHSWCGEGLWSNFRRIKPEVFDALCDGWSDLRFCLFVPSCIYSGESFEIEAVLANEGVLKNGKYTADFAIGGSKGIVWRSSEDFEISAGISVIPIMKKYITLDAEEGDYCFYAALREGGAPMGRSKPFCVYKKPAEFLRGTVAVCKISQEIYSLIKSFGLDTVDCENADENIPVIVGNGDKNDLDKILFKAKNGAKVFFTDGRVLDTVKDKYKDYGLPEDLSFLYYVDWLYHKEVMAAVHPFNENVELGLIPGRKMGKSFPHWIFRTDAVPSEVILPAFQTGYHVVAGGYALSWALAGFSVGNGTVYVNTVNFERGAKEPFAAEYFRNLLKNLIKKTCGE